MRLLFEQMQTFDTFLRIQWHTSCDATSFVILLAFRLIYFETLFHCYFSFNHNIWCCFDFTFRIPTFGRIQTEKLAVILNSSFVLKLSTKRVQHTFCVKGV